MPVIKERKPSWLKVKLPSSQGYFELKKLVDKQKLNTICEDSLCPNIAECWQKKHLTFMILGDICTRSCSFCSVKSGRPKTLPDPDEPRRVAESIAKIGLKYAVVTSVNRDDIPDGGASHFAELIVRVRDLSPQTKMEVLIPDLMGDLNALKLVWDAKPDVLSHNVECVKNLQIVVRSKANWERSLMILEQTRKNTNGIKVKTGIQVGHGETWDELLDALDELAKIGIEILTIGQYLKPTKFHRDIKKYYTPDEFQKLYTEAKSRGIRFVFSGPLVRSSYRAGEVFEENRSGI